MDELGLPDVIETLRFCKQKLMEHKSALKTVPGDANEVDVRMNTYKPNPDGVRFVSAIPNEFSAKASNRGAPVRPVTRDSFTAIEKVDVVKFAELGFSES